jgi:SNF2 family DNA or RNA helicase
MLTRDLLHPYQERCVDHVINTPKSALWVAMGLGKTLTSLTAIVDLKDMCEVTKVLIIAPLRVCNTVWHAELKAWEHTRHLTYRICTGSEKQRLTNLLLPADIHIINRENIKWLVDYYGKKWPFDMVVVDESSSFKSSSSQRFKALKKVYPFIDRMVQLSGTPSPNGMMDVWSQVALLDGGERLGRNMTQFKSRYFDADFMGYKYELKKGAQANIENKISDLVISMKAEDYLELPDRIDLIEHVELKPAVLKRYKEFENDLVLEVESQDDAVLAVNAAVLAGKLMQYANGSVYLDDTGKSELMHNEKLDALAQIVEDNESENMLVAYNFKFDLEQLLVKFPQAVVLSKSGIEVEQWNNGEIKMLLAHPASAGHGLNLQRGGSLLIWYGLNWSLELYQQFNARLHRQGQEKPVRIVHIVAKDTIDERVMIALSDKEAVQDNLLNALKMRSK